MRNSLAVTIPITTGEHSTATLYELTVRHERFALEVRGGIPVALHSLDTREVFTPCAAASGRRPLPARRRV